MDIKDLKPVERVIEIVHPVTGENIGIKVSLLSLKDERMKRIKRKLVDERLMLESKGKTLKSEDIERNGDVLLFNAMTGWEWYGDITFNGEKPAFNRKNVMEILDQLVFFKDQLEEAINDEQAFFTI